MLNSVEHEILNAYMYKKISRNSAFLGSDNPRVLFFTLINVKMPTFVRILIFMSRKNFMLSSVEHEKSFITLGPGFLSLYHTYLLIRWGVPYNSAIKWAPLPNNTKALDP